MTRIAKLSVVGIMAVVFVFLALDQVFANHLGVSQFLANKSQRAIKLTNPTGREMFALWLQYNEDGSYDDCDSVVIAPHETTSGFCCGTGTNEIISAPTGPGLLAVLTNHRVGLVGRQSGGEKQALFMLDPLVFSVTEGDAKTCACDELDAQGLPLTLLRPFGIRCD